MTFRTLIVPRSRASRFRNFTPTPSWIASLISVATLSGHFIPGWQPLAAQDIVRRLDGARFNGQVVAIATDGAIRYAAEPKTEPKAEPKSEPKAEPKAANATQPPAAFPAELASESAKLDLDIARLDDLLSIRFQTSAGAASRPPADASSIRVTLRDRSRLHVDSLRLGNERLELTSAMFRGVLTVAIDAVARIEWAAVDALPPPTDLLWRPSADQDRLLVRDGTTVRAVAGIVEQMDSEQITLDVDGEQRKLPRARIAALVFATPELPTPPPSARELRLVDGSRWNVSQVSLDERGWQAISGGLGPPGKASGGSANPADRSIGASTVALPREVVEELVVRSPRLRWLSELQPREVTQRTLVAWPLTWGRDRAVSGGPLLMSGLEFARGLGTQAGTRLTYELPAGAAWFAATVGLDDAARDRGDCIVVVHEGGPSDEPREPLARVRIRGGERPRELLVPVAGHKRLTLVVEPGVGFDVGDHVDWGDARLIVAKAAP